jgi:ribonuclease HI
MMVKQRDHRAKLKDFADFMAANGAIALEPTNDYELLRVRLSDGVHVAYRRKGGRENWPERLTKLHEQFKSGVAPIESLAPAPKAAKVRKNYITIIADASLENCHGKPGFVGYAAWMIGGGKPGSEVIKGVLKQKLVSTTEAELLALANAIVHAEKAGRFERGITVMVQSDSTGALGCLMTGLGAVNLPKPDSAAICPPAKKIIAGVKKLACATIKEILERHGAEIIVRHVRGHQAADGRDGRGNINAHLDGLAKDQMRNARENAKHGL